MNTLVNEKVIHTLFDDNSFNTELKAMLNVMIDEELSKEPEDMDCDLIDECVQMLIDIEQESDKGFAVFVPLLKSSKIISACEKSGFKHLSRGVRASLIACIILLSAMTTNAAVAKIFDYNIAQEVVNSISEKLKDWGIIANADDNREIVIDKVPTTFPTTVSTNVTTTVPTATPSTSEKAKVEETTTQSAGTNKPETTALPTSEEKTTPKETTTELQAENINQTYDNSQVDPEETTTEPVNEETTTQPPSDIEDVSAQTYTLTLDADGGKCDVSSVEVTYGKPIGDLPVPTKNGYEFGGWYNKDISYVLFNGRKEEAPLKSNTIYNLEKDATVTAKWYEIYTVIFNAAGGQCDVESLEFSALTGEITLPTPTREGYIFRGWYDAYYPVTGSDLSLRAMFSNPLILTAHWTEVGQAYTVEFDANGGYCNVKKKDVIIGQPYGELPTPTKSGWKFLGWFNGSHVGLEGVEQITEDSIATYYSKLWAVWYKTTPTITFDANGGQCDAQSKTVYSGNLYGELPTPTREGYMFGAWSYNNQAIYSFSYVDDDATDHTLTAVWIPVDVPVSFNANGGRMSSNNEFTLTQTYGYMTEYGSLPDATRTGYKLVGWYTEREGGNKVEETDIVDFLDGIALYAHWEKDENICTVTLYSNSNNSSALTYNKGDKFGNPKPTADGSILYDFAGWYTDKYYGEKVDGDFEITDDIEFYAHWVLKSTVTIALKLDKTEYELNEKIDIRKIDMVFSVGNYIAGTITGEMLAEDGARLDYDTSTYGEHTLTVTLVQDWGYMVTIEASTAILVKGCEHDKGTYIVNQVDPTCVKEGYTGDVICNGCNEILEKGSAIKAIGHDENTVTEIINKKEATCSETGYTGDTVCTVCGEVLQTGKTINKTDHITEDVITKATFSQNGKITKICTMCGQQISSTIIYRATAVLSADSYIYDGKMKTPDVSVKPLYGSEKIDYTVTMDEGRTDPGIYKVYITINSDYYEDEMILTFSIELPTITLRLTATADGFIAEWDKVDGVDGYEILFEPLTYGSSSTVTLLGDDSNSLTVENLSEGIYYVYIRTFKNGVASPWSAYQKVIVG